MGKEIDNKNLQVFQDVIAQLAIDSIEDVDGVEIVKDKRGTINGVTVAFLEGDRVDLSISIVIELGLIVPVISATVQEKIVNAINKNTKYRAHCVDVNIDGVNGN